MLTWTVAGLFRHDKATAGHLALAMWFDVVIVSVVVIGAAYVWK